MRTDAPASSKVYPLAYPVASKFRILCSQNLLELESARVTTNPMRGARVAALVAALLTTATADLAVHVKTYSDAACSTAVADYQVPWKYGAASSGHTCVAMPAALTTALGLAAGTHAGFAGQCSADDGFAYYCIDAAKSGCESSLGLVAPGTKAPDAVAGCSSVSVGAFKGVSANDCQAAGNGVYQTYELIQQEVRPVGTLMATAYVATGCTGTSADFAIPVNNGCATIPDAYSTIITAPANRRAGYFTDSSNYYSCSMAHDEISANGGQASCV